MWQAGSAVLAVAAAAILYAFSRAQKTRRGRKSADPAGDFRPCVGYTKLDGMASLSLLLRNQSSEYVWVEQVEILLTELKAEDQTAEATARGVQSVRQRVSPGDTIPISLARVIYNAAGDPQRKYSAVLSSNLRFRIGDAWMARTLESYKIRMMGLTAVGVSKCSGSSAGPTVPIAGETPAQVEAQPK